MKKATSRKIEPTRASLRALPEVDVRAFNVHRNRFAARVAKEGITVRHDEPGEASLAEIPEVDLGAARLRRNPFATQVDASALQIRTRRGRPALGEEGGPTVSRSIRLPLALLNALAMLAKNEGITVHALMRRTLANRVRAELRAQTDEREIQAVLAQRGARAQPSPRPQGRAEPTRRDKPRRRGGTGGATRGPRQGAREDRDGARAGTATGRPL